MTQQTSAPNETSARVAQALIAAGIAGEYQERRGTITPNSQVVLARRYLAKDPDGTVTEDTGGMFRRVAQNLAQADRLYGADEDQVKRTEDRFHDAMRTLELLPNSPTLMNAGRELQQLSACFVLPVPDSLEGIFDGVKHTALIHKSGGGTGFAFSRLRPEGSRVGTTGGVASGPVSFINTYDSATDVVKQGGTRRGANMGILHISHPDILKFIRAKANPDRLQNFNISVGASDEFMQKAANGGRFDLVDPLTGAVTDSLDAQKVFDEISHHAWLTGDPGLVFLDRINAENPNPQLGAIESTNPCVTADTVVMTTEGLLPVRELIGRPFTAVLNGQEWPSTPQGFFPTGEKKAITVTTTDGRSLTLTPDHQVRTRAAHWDRWNQAGRLQPGDLVVMTNRHMPSDGGHAHMSYSAMADTAGVAVTQRQTTATDHCPAAVVESVRNAGIHQVYDTQIPGINAFDGNGFYLHQCGEQPLAPYESCNLASINLARMTRITPDGVTLDHERLARTVETAVHLLDNVIDMNSYPLPQVDEMTKRTRRIGLGVMGLADMLIQMGLRYDSEEALEMTRRVMSTIHELTHTASSNLAHQRGTFPAWDSSVYGPYLAGENSRPMRNSAPTTVAPTGTISIIAGASSGVEPLFALAYERNVMDNTRLVESNPYLEAIARHEGFHSEDLMSRVAHTGNLEQEAVPQWVKDLFRTSQEIAPEWHVRMQAAVQEHVDNAVSKTINFPAEATQDDIARAYRLAYELGCKGITVYRDGSKENQVLSTGRTGAAPAEAGNGHRPSLLTPRERPRDMTGTTQRLRTGHGNMYITVNYDADGVPFEVFGNLGKAGGCDSAQLEAITRLTTLCLRSAIDPEEVIQQLRGITCCPAWDEGTQIMSSPDALALALDRLRNHHHDPSLPGPDGQPKAALTALRGPKCKDCGHTVMVSEGCYTCPNCGHSECF